MEREDLERIGMILRNKTMKDLTDDELISDLSEYAAEVAKDSLFVKLINEVSSRLKRRNETINEYKELERVRATW